MVTYCLYLSSIAYIFHVASYTPFLTCKEAGYLASEGENFCAYRRVELTSGEAKILHTLNSYNTVLQAGKMPGTRLQYYSFHRRSCTGDILVTFFQGIQCSRCCLYSKVSIWLL